MHSKILAAILVVSLASVARAQEKIVVPGMSNPEGTTIFVPDDSGTLVQHFVPDDQQVAANAELAVLRETVSWYRSAGYEELLEFSPLDSLATALGVDGKQLQSTKDLLTKYRSLPRVAGVAATKRQLEFLIQLRAIVPESSLGENFKERSKRRKGLYIDALVRQVLDADQQSRLVVECDSIQDELQEALKKVEAIEKECRGKYRKIFEKVFNNRQKLESLARKGQTLEMFLMTMSVKDMCSDTEIKEPLRENVKN